MPPLMTLLRSRFSVSAVRALTLACVTLASLGACVGGTQAPEGSPKGTLALGGDADPQKTQGPFAVVFGAPKGPTTEPPEVSLVFNRPMVPMELAGNEKPSPARLTPDVKGRWQWVGTNAITFVPDVRLPRATEFSVEVPAGTKTLAGESLDKPYSLHFSTARPKVLGVDADTDQSHLSPESTFTLQLNQPFEVAEIKRATSIFAGAADALIPFEVKPRDADNEQVFVLTPQKKLPLGADIRIETTNDLKGKEGPLTAGEARSFNMSTYGQFKITSIECSQDAPQGLCTHDGGLSIEFSNDTNFADVKKAVRIEPKVDLRWSSWMGDEQEAQHFYVSGAFKPGRRYTLTVSGAGLKDVYGQPMNGDYSRVLEFGDMWPTVEMGVEGTYVEPNATNEIAAYVVNAADAELAYAPLAEDEVFAAENPNYYKSPFSELLRKDKAQSRKMAPASGRNMSARHAVKIEDILGKEGRGPIEIGVRYTYRPGTRWARDAQSTRVLQVTDIAISGKVSPEGSLLWVTKLSSGAPIVGAQLNIRTPTEKLISHTTDKDGFVLIPSSEFVPKSSYEERAVVVVKDGKDWSYRPLSDLLSGYRFGAPFEFDAERAFGLVFSDAGIYRPGDTARIKGIVREPLPKGTHTPLGRTVTVHVESPDGQSLMQVERKLSAFGTFDVDVPIPITSKLGSYQVWTELSDAEVGTDASTSFEVAEYRVAEFKVSAETDRPSYIRGDTLSCTARGDYLYGAPMAKSDAHISIARGDSAFSPPGVEGYGVSDGAYLLDLPNATVSHERLHSSDAKLDTKGSVAVSAKLTMPGQKGPETVMCEAEVTDVSRQVLSGSTTAIVHPAERYLAMKTGDSWFIGESDPIAPEVIAVDPKGVRGVGQKVKVDLIRRSWALAREKNSRGGLHRVSTAVDKVVATCALTTSQPPASCSLKPSGAGYYIVRATSEDSRKNPMAVSSGVYVLGEGSSGWRDSDDNKLGLVADKKAYAVGQTAKVLIKSPFPSAEALITVERSGVYTREHRLLKGSMPSISIPITDEFRPNVYVSVLLVRGRSKAPPKDQKGADVGVPAYRFGAIELPIDPESRRLAVKVAPDSSDKRPGQEVSVSVDVRDQKNKAARAEVTLYAVDEGVLSLIDYETPDPVGVMSEPRPLRVGTMESREALARTFHPFASLGLDKGKDGGDGASAQRSFRHDFRTSAYFHPKLVTDEKGHIDAKFKLPESLTTYRIMAVVSAEDDRYGYGQSYVTTSRPLMARPALPRFLRAGDSMDAGAVITSKGIAKTSVDVDLSVEGISLKGPSKKTIDLEPGQSIEVRFPMEAPRVGPAKLRFTAKGGGEVDQVEVTRQVATPLALEAVALYGDTESQSVEALGDMSGIRSDVGALSIATSSTALVGLAGGVEQLIEYPYGCTEQLTSRLVPLIPIRQFGKEYGLPLPKNMDQMVLETVAKIIAHQRSDGGFGLWAGSERSSAWLTAYALWGLHQAKKSGAPIPATVLESATSYLKDSIETIAKDPWERAAVPFLLDVLAEVGTPDVARMNLWFEDRKQLPLFARAHLLHAMAISKQDRKAIFALTEEIEQSIRLNGPIARVVSNHGDNYAMLFDSDIRSTALVLRALMSAMPKHALGAKLAAGLLMDRHGGTWRSTQETAWALLALDDYRKAQEKQEPHFMARVFLGQAEIGSQRFDGRTLSQSSTTLLAAQVTSASGNALGFKVDGSGRLFYEARLRYARKELPKAPIDRGFFVSKTYRAVKPEDLANMLGTQAGLGSSTFDGGDLIVGEVTVVTPNPRRFVAVDDPLPAGFEAIDARLATSSRTLNEDVSEDDGDFPDEDDIAMGRAYFPSDYIREIRDDRVLFFIDYMPAGMYRYRYLARATTIGTFVLPPARAEEMYAPEIFGRTAAGSITVNAK